MEFLTTGCSNLDVVVNQTISFCSTWSDACTGFVVDANSCGGGVSSLGRIVEMDYLTSFTWVGDGNGGVEIDLNGIEQLSNLTRLELTGHGTRLRTVPAEIGTLGLSHLDLSDNWITTLPEALSVLTGLRYLDLRGTKIQTLNEKFGKLPALESLFLPPGRPILLCTFRDIWEKRQTGHGTLAEWFPSQVEWCPGQNATERETDAPIRRRDEMSWQVIMVSAVMVIVAVGAGIRAKRFPVGGETTMVLSRGGPKDPAISIIGERLRTASQVTPSFMSSSSLQQDGPLKVAARHTEISIDNTAAAAATEQPTLTRTKSSMSRGAMRKESEKRLRFQSDNPQYADIVPEDFLAEMDFDGVERRSRVSTENLPTGFLEMPTGYGSVDMGDPSRSTASTWRTRMARLSSIPRAMRYWGSYSDMTTQDLRGHRESSA